MTTIHYMKSRLMAGLCLGLVLGLTEMTAAAERRVGQGETYATIAAALAGAGSGDTILINTNLLTETGIVITNNIIIQGLGMTNTIVQAAASRSNTVARMFTVNVAKNVTLRDMTLRYAYYTNNGACLYMNNNPNVTLLNCLFTHNDATNGGGGAVYFNTGGIQSMTNCIFATNTATAAGGAISAGNANMANLLSLDNCTFVGNVSTGGDGGGLMAGMFGQLQMRNCTFTGNTASWGAGAYFDNWTSQQHNLFNCTFTANIARSGGGGIRKNNHGNGIGIWAQSCIFADNVGSSGPDVYNQGSSSIVVTNSLIRLTSGGAIVSSDCLTGQDPKLLPVAFNGGPTPTCALDPTSPCIGKGSNPANLSYDQRGPGYPRAYLAPDYGAVEWIPSARSLGYATNTFYEWYANNGTINNDSPMRIALANDTFLGTNGQDFVTSSLVTPGNVPAGLTAVITRVDSNNLSVALTGTALNHTSADNVANLTFTFADGAFAQGDAASVANSTKSDLNVVYRDAAVTPVLTYTGAGYWEVAANDGSVSNLPIVVTLVNEHFAGTNGQNLAAGGWVTASSLPSGLTLAATKISDFQVNLTLTGAASLPHSAANNVETLAFQFLDGAFFSQPASAVTDASKGGFFVRFLNPRLNYGGTVFSEANLNDGSIGNTLALTLFGDALTGTNNEEFVASGKATAGNVPAGLTAALTRTSVTNLTASLTGKAVQHAFADSIANLTFTFDSSAFSNTVAAVVTNYAVANLAVNFITNSITYYVATDGVDVGRTGLSLDQAFKTITNALARCRDAASDVVQLGVGTFGQTNIAVSKVVVIRGMGANDTILQGGSDTNTTVSRFFTTSGGNNRPIVIRDMTMRFGGTNNGGAIYQGTQSPLYLSDCTVVSNCASGSGGAIYQHDGNAYYGRLIASNCLFVGNVAFASANEGGGAIRTLGGNSASFYGCTFMGNNARSVSGGAIYSQTALTFRNTTFWGNRSGTSGGAIWINTGNNYMYNCTISSNSAGSNAGAIYAGSSSCTMSIYNSIIGTNTSGSGSANIQPPNGNAFSVYRSVMYGTYNGTTLYDGCITGQDPKVLPPADNGGLVLTCALQSSSPCIGAANATTSLAFDQRGFERDAAPDIGACEYGAHAPGPAGTVLSVR